MLLTKAKELKDIDLDEISFVKTPANRKTFLFFKGLEKSGNYVCPKCGYRKTFDKPVQRPKCSECGTTMECAGRKMKEIRMNWEKDEHLEELFKHLEDKDKIENIDLAKEYEEFLGEKMDDDQLEKQKKLESNVLNAVKGAFRILNKWRTDLPEDLKSAVSTLAKYAGGKYPYPKPYKKNGSEDKAAELLKAGKQHSKATIDKLLVIRRMITELLPDHVKKTTEEEDKEQDALEMLKDICSRLEQLEKSESNNEDSKGDKKDAEDDPLAKVSKQLTNIADRLEVVEKNKGTKKGLEEDGSDLEKADSEDPFPSIKIGK